jgi:hypothetical protein
VKKSFKPFVTSLRSKASAGHESDDHRTPCRVNSIHS